MTIYAWGLRAVGLRRNKGPLPGDPTGIAIAPTLGRTLLSLGLSLGGRCPRPLVR